MEGDGDYALDNDEGGVDAAPVGVLCLLCSSGHHVTSSLTENVAPVAVKKSRAPKPKFGVDTLTGPKGITVLEVPPNH